MTSTGRSTGRVRKARQQRITIAAANDEPGIRRHRARRHA